MNYDIAKLYEGFQPHDSNIRGFVNPLQYLSIEPTDNCLDLGCGGGFDCQEMGKTSPTVLGVDIQEKMIEYAQQNNPGPTYKVSDLLHTNLDSDLFDKIISNCVFLHIEDKVACLDEIYRLLKKGGWFCFSDITTKKSMPSHSLYEIESDEYIAILSKSQFRQTYFLEEKHVKIDGNYSNVLCSTFIGQK